MQVGIYDFKLIGNNEYSVFYLGFPLGVVSGFGVISSLEENPDRLLPIEFRKTIELFKLGKLELNTNIEVAEKLCDKVHARAKANAVKVVLPERKVPTTASVSKTKIDDGWDERWADIRKLTEQQRREKQEAMQAIDKQAEKRKNQSQSDTIESTLFSEEEMQKRTEEREKYLNEMKQKYTNFSDPLAYLYEE